MMLKSEEMDEQQGKKKRTAADYSLIGSLISIAIVALAILCSKAVHGLLPDMKFPAWAFLFLFIVLIAVNAFSFFAGLIGLKRSFQEKAGWKNRLKALFGLIVSLIFLFALLSSIPSNPIFQSGSNRSGAGHARDVVDDVKN